MKRNYGIAIMAIFTVLKSFGVNIDISEHDVDTIGQGLGGVIAFIGMVHDIGRKFICGKKDKEK